LASGKKRRIDLKTWIFSGSSDECDASALNRAKKGVLLPFVETVKLIDKEHPPVGGKHSVRFSPGDLVAHVFDARRHCAEGRKRQGYMLREELG
jgi:hypothetical protein